MVTYRYLALAVGLSYNSTTHTVMYFSVMRASLKVVCLVDGAVY